MNLPGWGTEWGSQPSGADGLVTEKATRQLKKLRQTGGERGQTCLSIFRGTEVVLYQADFKRGKITILLTAQRGGRKKQDWLKHRNPAYFLRLGQTNDILKSKTRGRSLENHQ